MKKTMTDWGLKILLACFAILTASVSFAQEGEVLSEDKAVSSTTTTWYSAPWVWMVGAAVFILLLAAIVRGGRRAD